MRYQFTLRAARAYKGFSGEDAAAALHLSIAKLYRLESGKDIPDAQLLLECAQLYGIDPRDMVLLPSGVTE